MSSQPIFKSGDKVRCIRKREDGWENNYSYIEVGQVYTVFDGDHTYHQDSCLTLVEVNATHPEGPFYVIEDFVHASETSTIDTDDAWDRAMGIL